MQKITKFLLGLLWGMGQLHATALFQKQEAPTVVHEQTFVCIIRDMELLNSWLIGQGYGQEKINTLRQQHYQKILVSYGINQQAFQESVQYYLVYSLDRAIKIYEQVYAALEQLLPL